MIVFCTGVDMLTTLHCLYEMQRLDTTVAVFYIGLAVITRLMIEINAWSADERSCEVVCEFWLVTLW
jgi:hypothetical protein